MAKLKKVALIYDFDKTLIKGDMQRGAFVDKLKVDIVDYWIRANKIADESNMDVMLASMYIPLVFAKENKVKFDKEFLVDCGHKLNSYYLGVEDWFKRIEEYGLSKGLDIEHYVISGGFLDIIKATSIAHNFRQVFACSYVYDKNGNAVWPANLVNFTQKTQYLSRIEKNLVDNINETSLVNKKYKKSEIYIPYSRMVYFGDGETDVPCMRVVKGNGGYSICVCDKSNKRMKDISDRLVKDRRVNYAVDADYSENSELDKKVKLILSKIK